jgi:hypothetical protein
MAVSPLNPALYSRLTRDYGEVGIVNGGVANCWEVVWTRNAGDNRLYPSRSMQSPGEEYQVRCKRCLDHRARLQINHMWGVHDPETIARTCG